MKMGKSFFLLWIIIIITIGCRDENEVKEDITGQKILADKLRPIEGCEGADGLDPMAEPSIWAEKLERIDRNIMLVGHLPHLGNLAGVLLYADMANNPINFHNSGIIKLIRNSESQWLIDWIIAPSFFGSYAIPRS